MGESSLQSWREVVEANPHYQRLVDEDREDAERRAKWMVAHMGEALVMGCADLAALACEQGLDLERLRDELADARRRLETRAAGGDA